MPKHQVSTHQPKPPARERSIPRVKAGHEVVTLNRNRAFTDRKKENSRRACRKATRSR